MENIGSTRTIRNTRPIDWDKVFRKIRKAGIFAFDNITHKILLVQTYEQYWGLPKGSIEENESVEQCAIRETKEETGIDITTYKLNNHIFIYNTKYYVIRMKECPVSLSTTLINNDATNVGWFTFDQLKKAVEETKTMILNSSCKIALERLLGWKFNFSQ